MPVAHVRLNKKHLAKLNKGQNFQLSHEQLQGKYPAHEETMDAELELSIPHHKKYAKHMREGKGHRFDAHHIIGGSFGSFFKKVGNVAKSVAKTVAPVVVPLASNALKGLADSYAPELAPLTNTLINAGASKALQVSGNGLRKGSPEAKAHMARLREMRMHKGKGFFGDLAKKAVKSVSPALIQQGSQLAKSALNQYAPSALHGIGNQLIDLAGSKAQSTIDGAGMRRKRHGHCGGSFSGGSFGGAMGTNYSPVLKSNSPYFHDQRFIAPARGSAVGGSFR